MLFDEIEPISLNEFRLSVMRTARGLPEKDTRANIALGLFGETAEIVREVSMVGQGMFQPDMMAKEIGDAWFYGVWLAEHFDLPLQEDLMMANRLAVHHYEFITRGSVHQIALDMIVAGGEIGEMMKKANYHDKEINVNDLRYSFGFYMSTLIGMANVFFIKTDIIWAMNKIKLEKRHPGGFSSTYYDKEKAS